MDLSTKLSMLTGDASMTESDLDLMGVDTPTVAPRISPSAPEASEEPPDVLDFNLGDLSIDALLGDEDKKPRKSKKSTSEPLVQSSPRLFDNLFDGLEDPNEIPTASKYRTGNSDLDEATARARKLLEEADLIKAESFDAFLDDEDAFSAEEDVEMRNQLLAMGRKYARDSAASKESSEISKAYADTEKRLNDLFQEVSAEKASIQKDIERMRVPGRGGKMLSDMLEVKGTMHNTQLSIIKEMNAMKKTIFELRAKEAARKEAEASGGNDINANTLQSIFSSARNTLVDSIGGYGRTGSDEDDGFSMVDNSDDDETIQRKYFQKGQDHPSSDGDLFLKYENRGVEMVLVVDSERRPQSIIAEDKDGIMIPDYPLPNMDGLEFEMDMIAKTATDNFNRNYQLRVED